MELHGVETLQSDEGNSGQVASELKVLISNIFVVPMRSMNGGNVGVLAFWALESKQVTVTQLTKQVLISSSQAAALVPSTSTCQGCPALNLALLPLSCTSAHVQSKPLCFCKSSHPLVFQNCFPLTKNGNSIHFQ